jgi:hypothetical protein
VREQKEKNVDIDDKIARAEAVIQDAWKALKRRNDYRALVAKFPGGYPTKSYNALYDPVYHPSPYLDQLEAAQRNLDEVMSILLPLAMADVRLAEVKASRSTTEP